ncbi:hypothetical protein [Cryptosporangium aurantiacum]|uniref:Uncharacterized protein n=1 Tax=Cryptosporangium aurantiacum TaxID=134849 RepID=A0A1M7TXH5_9ACTN|nr:hypothetical protein [Cryptosporangium aurantiacum]SHN75397.1 hypothetical protein SAMN05443668_107287 [Cryptosporangium aurantiacum]
MNADAPLVFPVGHYLGAVHPGGGAPPSFHVVRAGREAVHLSDEDEVDVWGLAHGLPSAGDGAWSRAQVLSAAADAGHPDAEPVLDALLERGLVVEVRPGTDDARDFARFYRLRPLLLGLGRPAGEDLDLIGVPGLVVALRATPRVLEVWEWAHLWPNLWAASEGLAEAGRDTGRTDPSETEPDQVLTVVLGAVQTLVAHGAAYLDHRATP